MEKKFLPYIPPSITIQGGRTRIVFYQTDPATHRRVRFQRSFGLNRIKNKKYRLEEARRICSEVYEQLKNGWPFTLADQGDIAPELLTVTQAMTLALDVVRERQLRKKSRQTAQSQACIFSRWLVHKKYESVLIRDFATRHAFMYMDHLVKTVKPAARTYNNYLTYARMFFKVLCDREIIDKNPFSKVPKRKVHAQTRHRRLTFEERQLIAGEILRKNFWLFLSIVLQYDCFIRPSELRGLKVRDFDFKRGLIRVRSEVAKTHKERYVTIPAATLKKYFINEMWRSYPGAYCVFGKEGKPGPVPVGRDDLSKAHKKIVDRLVKAGKLDGVGVTYYCWKHTGITQRLNDGVPIQDVCDQAGHASLDQTKEYYQGDRVIKGIRKVRNDLIDPEG